ncbi:hypothetical protein HDV01_005685 [Terramyces sp. JEL0728]|nr:hypothetical protein HDV01_005685 [Terramyces sp. JEL0728]
MQLKSLLQFTRGYKKQIWQTAPVSLGRSVIVDKNVNQAYNELRNILNESNVRKVVRSQQRFESFHDKKKRLRKERDWGVYLAAVKKNVKVALHMKQRSADEKQNYDHL